MTSRTEKQIRKIIQLAAVASGFTMEGETSLGCTFQVHLDAYHGADYQIKKNSDYIQVQCNELQEDGEWKYGRAIFSIRSVRDAFSFANIIIGSADLRAKR
jgi:hypothetical protein